MMFVFRSACSIRQRIFVQHLAVLALLWGGFEPACHGANEVPRITKLADLNRMLETKPRLEAFVEIEGTVWWSSKAEGRVILSDDTAVLYLELDLPCEMPALGERLVLSGDCLAVKARDWIKLSGVPVVDHDGIHALTEKSGTIELKKGCHPIRVAWFDRTKSYGLTVRFEGPDIPRQKIPDAVLFRLRTDKTTGIANLVNGLDYGGYEGQWWRLLPNFDHVRAVKTGVVNNFDIEVRSRNNHVGLQFSGYIEVPKDGTYTFYLQSDDGSRLFIGDSSLRVLTNGRGSLPSSGHGVMDGIPEEGPEFQWSEIEGTVVSFDRTHGALEVDLKTRSGLVRVNVVDDSGCSYLLMPQNRIRVAGVSRRIYSLDGSWGRSEFFVQRWDDVEQRSINPRIWAEYPLVNIGDLIPVDLSDGEEAVVHLRGLITSTGAGQILMLEDETGRIILDGAESDVRGGQSMDVLGLVGRAGSNLVLRCAHFQRLEEGGSTVDHRLPLLTTAEQICQLSLEEAARGYPVKIRGVITSPLEYDGAVLQDSSRGIYVHADEPVELQIGDYCEIAGMTGPFEFQPYVEVSQLQKLGTGKLPAPVQPTWDQLINGSMHCNFVELEGVVSSVKDRSVVLLTRDGRINVRLNPIGPAMPKDALGATVRLRGCLLSDWDGESRRVVVGSIYLDQQKISVIRPAPINPFSIPLKRVGDLLQFDPLAGALQRVRVSGQLIYQNEQISYLLDGGNGLRFIPLQAGEAQVGDLLEVVGFVDLSGPSPLLRDAEVRRVGQALLPIPGKLKGDELVQNEYDSTLMQVDGVLLGVSKRPDGIVLEMQSGLRRFTAMLDDPAGMDESLAPGSHLQLTGVYAGQGGNRVLGRPIDSFELLLNSGRDVNVLSRPPWWTLERLLLTVSLLLGGLLAALLWINLLHRKVEERTQQLGDQIKKRQRVEHKRAIEQERSRLAHDLHDDLGSGLTEVNMLASLVKSPATSADERARYTDQLNDLALRMVTSLDEIVWAENPRNDTLSSLAGYFGSYAQRLLELGSVGCGLDVAEDLPDHSLDPRFRQELFLAFKEALTNIIQHAEATKVWLRIQIQDDELVVIVSDDGCGIIPDVREHGADGLANMRGRMQAVGGQCEIHNDPGKGTTVCLRAPIQGIAL